jgi:DNA replication protein DnaC
MSDDAMQPVSGLVAGFGAKLGMVAGICEQHGAADVLTRAGLLWQCPRCMEASIAADTRAKWEAQRTADLIAGATIPKKYLGARFMATTEEQRTVRVTVQHFRDLILAEPTWAALILIGETGTGKTLLACEFAQKLMARAFRSVRYVTAKGMIGEIQAIYGTEGKSEADEIERFVRFDVLIIDEIDALAAKENSALLLTEIINRRYNENKPVIVISNQPFDNLVKFVGARVHSRLHENAFPCAFGWGDYRRSQQAM